MRKTLRSGAAWLLIVALGTTGMPALAQQTGEQFTPQEGQPGKDVIWVPTPPETVEKMLDVAGVTPQDMVVDLGSGDGRNIIAAAKRGARALGIEYNPDLVEFSKRTAAAEGVGDKALFVQGDMFEADFSEATVLALFLLPTNLLQLRPKFLDLRPGTRIVSNTFEIQDWEADERVTTEGTCTVWCTVFLYIVPAKVAGTWRLPNGELRLAQEFQMVSGTFVSDGQALAVEGRLRGDQLTLTAGGREFTGRVSGDRFAGTVRSGEGESAMQATRVSN